MHMQPPNNFQRMPEIGRNGLSPVFDILREEIIALTLLPGTILPRAELQKRFQVSSTPIRDTLLRLQEEGLVDIFPQHATLVSPIDIGMARQAQFLRRSVEIEMVSELAKRPDAELIEKLRGLIRQQSAFTQLGEYAAFTQADQAFHRLLFDAAGITYLWQVLRRQSGQLDRIRRLNLPVTGKMREILADHSAIVDAIAAGQPIDAQRHMRRHLSKSIDFVSELRISNPEYFRD